MTVHLEPITHHNLHECLRLHVGPGQQHFVPANIVSLVQAYVEPAFVPRAIYDGDQMVGFVMYGRDPESEQDWIVRMMIDARYQGHGYGRAGLLLALEALRSHPGGRGIRVGYRPEDLEAARLYASVGFRPTGTLADGEIVAELRAGPAPGRARVHWGRGTRAGRTRRAPNQSPRRPSGSATGRAAELAAPSQRCPQTDAGSLALAVAPDETAH